MKKCFKCSQVKPIDEFYVHTAMADGHLGKCKDCCKAEAKQHRLEDPGVRERDRLRGHTEAHRESVRRHAASNKDRYHVAQMAAQKTRRAVKKGLLTKAEFCEAGCGSTGPLEGAHHDYSKPLEVRWLCRRCHRREDAAHPKSR